MKVWLIEHGEYEDRCVMHVIATAEDAPAVIRRCIEEAHRTNPYVIDSYREFAVSDVIREDRDHTHVDVTYGNGMVTVYDLAEWDVETRDDR